MKDKLVWKHTQNGVFSVKSGYQVEIHEAVSNFSSPSTSYSVALGFWKLIWHLDCPPKIRRFWWKACCNALASGENLYVRKCAVNPLCKICSDGLI